MIKLVKSTFYKESYTKKKLIKFITKSKQLSFGEECQKFEENFAKWQRRKFCIMVNSGSSANLALVQALLNLEKIKRNDYIGFSAVTWSTNIMPLIQLGLYPVPIDVELNTLNVSSKKLIKVLNKYRLSMLFLTNLLGFCDDIEQIRKICSKSNIILIEDTCEALGTLYKKRKLGNYGLASTFSFYVGHHMSTIEGGAVCTDNEELANMLRIVRAHGWDRNLDFTKQNELRNTHKINLTFYSRYAFYDLGYNLRPVEINGFIGNIQIKYLDQIIEKRRKNFMTMAHKIYERKDIYYPIKFSHIDLLSNFAVPLICRSQKIRDTLVKKCDGKIEIRPVAGGNIIEQPFYKKNVKKLFHSLPNAEIIHNQGLYFGNNPELTIREINQIVKIFTE